MEDSLDVVVLAAGKGTRMKSRFPKVLHLLAGQPLVYHVLRAALGLNPGIVIVVVGYGADSVRAALAPQPVTFVDQGDPLGTGHALLAAENEVRASTVLVLPGDAPLVSPQALRALVERHRRTHAGVTLLTAEMAEPGSYGRVIRRGGRPVRIVEAADASPAELRVREVNSGIYCWTNTPELWASLRLLSTQNAKGEYYLTDLVAHFAQRGQAQAVVWPDPEDLLGVNDRADLARAETLLRRRILQKWMAEGVTVVDPAAVYPSAEARVGSDTVIYPGTHILGASEIGEGCTIGPSAYLWSSRVLDGAKIWYSTVEEAWVGPGAQIGPYAHLRPGARIGAQARVGNFVEVKNATLGEEVRAAHLAYIGDAEVGAGANIGAGAITCNFQPGKKEKFRTEIGAGAFIGSNAALVAPVRIGEGAVVGAGSVITSDVPPYALALERSPQEIRRDWAKPNRPEGGHGG